MTLLFSKSVTLRINMLTYLCHDKYIPVNVNNAQNEKVSSCNHIISKKEQNIPYKNQNQYTCIRISQIFIEYILICVCCSLHIKHFLYHVI